jgi:tetratricopeptide (TPR) repeat protein
MEAAFRARVQNALGDAYRLDRELGGGGMSRVFVAEETALGRTVALKVLSPELAAGISIERFKREIQVAARLQHPHVVPVHSAGDVDGLPYYTMPFVQGQSLRARLAEKGALPAREAVAILRDVARALEYAHGQGVVHRDIKPDNVLIAGSSATVTDFGIAKAISASRTGAVGATLTSVGTSLGTPAYIAPEQAAGDVHADHRADLYSFGCMAYEMLAGRTPFGDLPPQKLFVAHLSEKPEPVTELRPDTPAALAALVMQCLEKEPDRRPESAGEVLRVLDAVASSGGHEAAPVVAITTRRNLGRALAIYAASFIAVAILSRAAILVIGLPDWVFPGSLIVMALGLPVILFTGLVHHQTRLAKMQSTLTPGGSATKHSTMTAISLKASPWLTWRRTAMGGVWTVGAFTALVGVWMALRALGIGPAGSLLASGALKKDEPILLADFASPAVDTSLGGVVTDALRSELAQSKSLTIVPVTRIREMLQRMQRPANLRVDFAVARELASREGLKAIIDGEVLALGTSRVLVARLVATQTGDVLATFRETAKGDDEVVGAIDRLARDLREKVGESLRAIHATPSYERVTTPSFAAFKKYVQGDRLVADGDLERGHPLLEEAIALDSGFAMAYRRLAMSLNNTATQPARVLALMQKAYDHRERLSDVERYLTEGSYFDTGPHQDPGKAIAAYEAALELAPENFTALNNLGLDYRNERNFAKAEPLYRRALAVDSTRNTAQSGMVVGLASAGHLDDADKAAAKAERLFPRGATNFANARVNIAWAAGQIDSASRLADRMPAIAGRSTGQRATAANARAQVALARGKLRLADQLREAQDTALAESGALAAHLGIGLGRAFQDVWFRNDRVNAGRRTDAALAATSLASLDPVNRPHVALVRALAFAGRVDAARAALADFEATRRGITLAADKAQRAQMTGDIAMAERRYDAAAAAYREAAPPVTPWARLPDLARAYDLGGHADSALAVYARYAASSEFLQLATDATYLGPSLKRLGELYEAKGDRDNAAKQYARFVELWKNADPELQASVSDAKARLAKLRVSEGRRP